MSGPSAPDADRAAGRERLEESGRGLVAFANALRAGGARLGSGALLDANAALSAVGPNRRSDVRAALRTTLVRDPSDRALFDWLFEAFFPVGAEAAAAYAAHTDPSAHVAPKPGARRAAHGLPIRGRCDVSESGPMVDPDAAGTQSDVERLKSKDFEQMTAEELAAARALIPTLARGREARPSRRSRIAAMSGHLDLGAMLRRRDLYTPRYRAPRPQPRDLVLIVDISGSMSIYSRLFLHFAHALTRGPGRVETFLFATRLSRITRCLRIAEPDLAIAAASRCAPDWEGGTRLGACLADFNLHWGRRVLAGGARAVLLTDGLERDATELLEQEVRRLVRSVHELTWINPLLRSRDYAPIAAGAQVLVRHAASLKPAHNLASLRDLAKSIG